MTQFETILLFVRATRQRDMLLHMQSLEALIKYFFAHDHLNYARLMPLYIYTMQETEKIILKFGLSLLRATSVSRKA